MFWGELEPFGDEAVRPIIRSKSDLSAYVAAWLERAEITSIKPNTPDFDALLDACLDEYLVSNREISDGWKDSLADLEVMPNQAKLDTFGTLKRQRSNDPQRKPSAVFEKYLKVNSDLGKSARSEFGTGVRRLIEFHGDFAAHLMPHLAHPVDLEVLIPDPLHLAAQNSIPLGAIRRTSRITGNGQIFIEGRGGDRQNPADRLDPILGPVIGDEPDHRYSGRSSFA